MAENDPDLQLVLSLQNGDDSALDQLIERHQEPIFGFIYRHVLNEADARELTQEVFVRAYFGIGKFRPQAKFTTWLYQIALNLCRDHARSRGARQAARTNSLSEDQPHREFASDDRTPSEQAAIDEKMEALQRGLAELPHKLRTALVMTVFEQRSHKECAELLKTTAKSIEKRVYRARHILAEWMTRAGFLFLLGAWISQNSLRV